MANAILNFFALLGFATLVTLALCLLFGAFFYSHAIKRGSA